MIGGEFSGSVLEQNGILTIEGSFDFYLRDEFADPADIGVEVVDPGETIFENIHRPLDNTLEDAQAFRRADLNGLGFIPANRTRYLMIGQER